MYVNEKANICMQTILSLKVKYEEFIICPDYLLYHIFDTLVTYIVKHVFNNINLIR